MSELTLPQFEVGQWFSNILPLSPLWQEKILSGPPCFFYRNRSHGVFDILFSLFSVFLHTIIFSSILLKIKVLQY
jgi:hypothetical protein